MEEVDALQVDNTPTSFEMKWVGGFEREGIEGDEGSWFSASPQFSAQ